jgi:serine/threonine protein kinase
MGGEGTMMGRDLPGLVCVGRLNDGLDYAAVGRVAEAATGATAVPVRGQTSGEIYLARRLSDGAEVAVRVYNRPLRTARERLRFEEEISALKALNGISHVITMYDAGVSPNGEAYTVTEFCAAGSVYDHLATVGRMTPAEVRSIGAKLARALGTAHDQLVYHRNIKPSNVLINDSGEPVLADFALLSLATSGDFTPDAPSAPRSYVAPEAYLPELMSAPADIYALGATLYALLAGWTPQTENPLAMAVDGESIADLPRVPWALMSVLRRAMAHDPRDRFGHGEELATALLTST